MYVAIGMISRVGENPIQIDRYKGKGKSCIMEFLIDQLSKGKTPVIYIAVCIIVVLGWLGNDVFAVVFNNDDKLI